MNRRLRAADEAVDGRSHIAHRKRYHDRVTLRVATLLFGLQLLACRALDRDRYYGIVDASEAGDRVTPPADASDVRPMTGCGTMDSGADAGCDPIRIPARPAALGDTDGGVRTLTFVARRLTLGFESRSVWGTIGFDRDGVCTDPLRPSPATQACRPADSTAPAVEDGERGRDNAIAARMGPIFAAAGFGEADVNDNIEQGDGSMAARISFYGGSNDARVRVEWIPVRHGHVTGMPTIPPRWDGRDTWHADSTLAWEPSMVGVARIRSDAAFVTCGTLVAPIPSRVPIRLNGRRTPTRLMITGGHFVGAISADGSSLGPLDFSGWWPVSDALVDISFLGLCPPPPIDRTMAWFLVQRSLEGAADMLTTGDVSPTTPCDALSFAFRSIWVPIVLGPDEASAPLPDNACDILPDGGRG